MNDLFWKIPREMSQKIMSESSYLSERETDRDRNGGRRERQKKRITIKMKTDGQG